MKLVYDVSDKPKFSKTIVFALQQMIAIMAATLLVPMIVTSYGLEADPSAALFGAGIGTLVYIFFTKKKSPVFLGSSFTFLGAYAASVGQNFGYLGIILGVLFAGLVYVVIGLIIKFVGSGWVNKLMPAVIIGPIVALIGLSLSGTATSWMSTNGGDTYSLITILVGAVTFFAIVIASVKGSDNIKLIPFIVGIGVGYVFALVLTLIGMAAGIESLKILSFDSFTSAFVPFSVSSIVKMPDFFFLKAIQEKGWQELSGADIGSIALIYVPIGVVELAQHIADHKNLGNIINKDLITDPGLDNTLFGDGVGSIVGSIFGGAANTTYGESIGCVAITGNASIITIMVASLGCMILSFFTPFVALINSIPKCVMGGACVALYGFIAVSGLQMLRKVDLGNSKNLFIVSEASGEAIEGNPGEEGAGTLTQGTLEMSSVQIVEEMVNMIVSQRAYESNSKAVTTSDSMLEIANGLKR